MTDDDPEGARLSIRTAEPRDALAILTAHSSAVLCIARTHYDRTLLEEWAAPETPDKAASLEREIAEGRKITLVAETDRGVVGFGMAAPEPHLDKPDDVQPIAWSAQTEQPDHHGSLLPVHRFQGVPTRAVYIQAVYVHAEAAGSGIGSRILAELERRCGSGTTRFRLDASLNAEAFYARNGYGVTARGEHVLRSGSRMMSVSMHKISSFP